MEVGYVSIGAAFLAGILTFISPCLLPMVPIYIGYLGGSAVSEGTAPRRTSTMAHSLLFVVGFSVIYVAIGASVGLMGDVLSEHMPLVQRVGGILIVLLGLQLTGLIRIPFLSGERRFEVAGPPASSFPSSFLLGLLFGFAWTPCVGPTLGAISIMASATETAGQGAFLLAIFSAGLAVPFLVTAFALGSVGKQLRKLNQHLNVVSLVAGFLLMAIGLLVLTGQLHRLASQFYFVLPL